MSWYNVTIEPALATAGIGGRAMAATTLEKRLDELETKFSRQLAELQNHVSKLSEQVSPMPPFDETPWWKKIVGINKDDPAFEEAMRLGREYRESLRPQEDEEPV
jgi:hypothetical protein